MIFLRRVLEPAAAFGYWQSACRKNTGTSRRNRRARKLGEVAEWSKAHAWNACRRATVSRVRIPPSPPLPGNSPSISWPVNFPDKAEVVRLPWAAHPIRPFSMMVEKDLLLSCPQPGEISGHHGYRQRHVLKRMPRCLSRTVKMEARHLDHGRDRLPQNRTCVAIFSKAAHCSPKVEK